MELTVSVSPGKQFQPEEVVDNDKLNQLGRPTASMGGNVTGADCKLGPYFWAGVAGGTADALTGTVSIAPGALLDGTVVALRAASSNTGAAATLSINGGTAYPIQKEGAAIIEAGDIVAGQVVEFRLYSSVWQMVNPTNTTRMVTDISTAVGRALPYAAAGGTGNALTATLSPAPAALSAGQRLTVKATAANTGPATLVVSVGAGVSAAIAILKYQGFALVSGDISAGLMMELRYDGTNWILLNPEIPFGSGYGFTDGVALTVAPNAGTPNTKLDVSATLLGALFQNVAVTIDFGTTGANGLDTGSAAASTWYYVYVIGKADGTVAGLASTNLSPTLPSGYISYVRIGYARMDGSTHLLPFLQRGRRVWLREQLIFTAKNPAADNIYETLAGADLTAFQAAVPPSAIEWYGVMGNSVAANSSQMAVAADANGLGAAVLVTGPSAGYTLDGYYVVGPIECPILTAQVMYWKCSDHTQSNNRLSVTGWRL